MLKTVFTSAALALSLTAAHADSVTLTSDAAGATLHHAGVDMSLYWVDTPEGFEVTARYLEPNDKGVESKLLQMLLTAGNKVTFGLPGVPGQSFTFAATGDAVTVTAKHTWRQLASN